MKSIRIVSRAALATAWIALLGLALLGIWGAAPAASAAEALDGKAIFLAQKCNMCHSVSSAAIEGKAQSESTKGPDLSTVAIKADDATLGKYLRKQEKLNDKLHKKELKATDEELAALIAWLRKQAK